MKAERCHTGNQVRSRAAGGKAKSWRRQVATCIAVHSKHHFSALSHQHGARLRNLSAVSYDTFRGRMANPSSRKGIGGNTLFTYINRKSKEFRGTGLTRQQFNTLRLEWASQHKAGLAEELRQDIKAEYDSQRRCVHEARGAAREAAATAARLQLCDVDVDPATHWGMGSTHFPVAPAALGRVIKEASEQLDCGGRGGLRRTAAKLLPEASFVVRGTGRRLRVPRQTCCLRAHPGFCTESDADIKDAYAHVLSRLQGMYNQETAGTAVYRFRLIEELGELREGPAEEIHVSFMSLRGKPRYTAVYMEMVKMAADGQTYELIPSISEEAAVRVPSQGLHEDTFTANMMTSWKLAVSVARLGRPHEHVVMESLRYAVTASPGVIHVTGADILHNDVRACVPAEDRVRQEQIPVLGALSALKALGNRR